MSNELLNFALGTGEIEVGLGSQITIDELHNALFGNFDILERSHTYIQWIFPTDEASRFNARAPVLSPRLARTIAGQCNASLSIVYSFVMMLHFYGMRLVNHHPPVVERAKTGAEDRIAFLSRSTHNWLRITRILRSLKLLGLSEFSDAFLKALRHEVYTTRALVTARSSFEEHWSRVWVDPTEWPSKNIALTLFTPDSHLVAHVICRALRLRAQPCIGTLYAFRRHIGANPKGKYVVIGLGSFKRRFVLTPYSADLIVIATNTLKRKRVRLIPSRKYRLSALHLDKPSIFQEETIDASKMCCGMRFYQRVRQSAACVSDSDAPLLVVEAIN